MRAVIVVCLLSLLGVVIAFPRETYTDKYDNVDLDQILSNRRLLVPYVKCVLDQGKCSPDGKEMKANIKDAMATECAKCTNMQKTATKRILKHVITNEKDYWEQVKAKYDPEAKFSPRYEEAVAKDEVDKLFPESK